MTRAIIFVTNEEYEAQADRCMQYLEERGYEFEGLVRGDWTKVQHMFDNDGATVAIVAEEVCLDPNRKPRIEVATNQPASQFDRHHRTTRINRPGAAT